MIGWLAWQTPLGMALDARSHARGGSMSSRRIPCSNIASICHVLVWV